MPRSTKATFVSRLPTHEEISERAYDIVVARGSLHGFDQEHWFEAERVLVTTDGAAGTVLSDDYGSAPPKRVRRSPVSPTSTRRRTT